MVRSLGTRPSSFSIGDAVDGAGDAALLVGGAAAVELAVLDHGGIGLALVHSGDVADVHGVAVAVERDHARAVADAAEQVAHAVDDDLVVAQLLHRGGHELDHVALLAAQGGDAHDVLEEIRASRLRASWLRCTAFELMFASPFVVYRFFSTPVAALNSSMSWSHSATWLGSKTLFQKSSSHSSRSSSLVLALLLDPGEILEVVQRLAVEVGQLAEGRRVAALQVAGVVAGGQVGGVRAVLLGHLDHARGVQIHRVGQRHEDHVAAVHVVVARGPDGRRRGCRCRRCPALGSLAMTSLRHALLAQVVLADLLVEQAHQLHDLLVVHGGDGIRVAHVVDPRDVLVADAFDAVRAEADTGRASGTAAPRWPPRGCPDASCAGSRPPRSCRPSPSR